MYLSGSREPCFVIAIQSPFRYGLIPVLASPRALGHPNPIYRPRDQPHRFSIRKTILYPENLFTPVSTMIQPTTPCHTPGAAPNCAGGSVSTAAMLTSPSQRIWTWPYGACAHARACLHAYGPTVYASIGWTYLSATNRYA